MIVQPPCPAPLIEAQQVTTVILADIGTADDEEPLRLFGHYQTDKYNGVTGWKCRTCGWEFPTEQQAIRHLKGGDAA